MIKTPPILVENIKILEWKKKNKKTTTYTIFISQKFQQKLKIPIKIIHIYNAT